MLKDILAAWIIFQLAFLGAAAASIIDEIEADTYECHPTLSKNGSKILYVFPLLLFVQTDLSIKEYCANKLTPPND